MRNGWKKKLFWRVYISGCKLITNLCFRGWINAPQNKKVIIFFGVVYIKSNAVFNRLEFDKAIRWQNGSSPLRVLDLHHGNNKNQFVSKYNRVYIDAMDVLHIRNLTDADGGIYSCWQDDRSLATTKLISKCMVESVRVCRIWPLLFIVYLEKVGGLNCWKSFSIIRLQESETQNSVTSR